MLKNYSIDSNEVVHQIDKNEFIYDEQYIKDRYVKYGDTCRTMGILRLSYLLGSIVLKPKKILDVGYGNGAFLDICSDYGLITYGYDISNFKINSKHIILKYDEVFNYEYDVVCMFDSMEHMENPEKFLEGLRTKYVFVSVPNYKPELGDEWFFYWKHRRENEHLHHYSERSLTKFFKSYNYDLIDLSNVEDIIRQDQQNIPNITTAIFRRM